MPPGYSHSSSMPTTSQGSQYTCNRHQSCEPKESTAPQSRGQEDDYGEGDVSLQSYNCDFDVPACLTHSLHNANELLGKSLSDFRSTENSPITLDAGGGVYALQVGRETRIEVRMREDTQMVQLSVVVHCAKQIGDMPTITRRRESGGYLLLMAMMRYNSQLSRTAYCGRILACNGQFLFFQDMPISVLNETGMLHRKLDEFILKTVEIRYGFDRILKEYHSCLRTKERNKSVDT